MVPAVSWMSNQRYGEIAGHDTDSCSLGGTCGKKCHCAVAIRANEIPVERRVAARSGGRVDEYEQSRELVKTQKKECERVPTSTGLTWTGGSDTKGQAGDGRKMRWDFMRGTKYQYLDAGQIDGSQVRLLGAQGSIGLSTPLFCSLFFCTLWLPLRIHCRSYWQSLG